MSELPDFATTLNRVLQTSPFFRYVCTLRSKCSISRLAKKVQNWFNETGGKGKDFDYRFTGKDSRLFLHNFMFLIDVLEQVLTGMGKKVLHIHACLCLRECVSLFSRVTISDKQVSRLEEQCTSFYRGYNLFFNISSTIWTLGYVVPAHTQDMKSKYGLGLGLNSMEGREAKHIAIATYARNNTYQHWWEQIFELPSELQGQAENDLLSYDVNCISEVSPSMREAGNVVCGCCGFPCLFHLWNVM